MSEEEKKMIDFIETFTVFEYNEKLYTPAEFIDLHIREAQDYYDVLKAEDDLALNR